MILCKPKMENFFSTSSTGKKKAVLHRLSVDNINRKSGIFATKKGKTIVLTSDHLFEKAIDCIELLLDDPKSIVKTNSLLIFR